MIDENSDISIYSADGYFIEMQFFHGGGYVLTYSDATTPATTAPRPGLLTKVTDNWNHTLTFQYDSQSRMVLMVDAAMSEYRYSYDTDGNLVSITYPDMASRLYHYDEPEFSANSSVNHGLLTGISEEVSPGNIQRFSIYQYSARDAISSEHAGGAQKYVFDYIKSTVTEPLGLVRSVYWATVLGRRVITDRAQPNASGRGLDYVSTSYDAAGNISSIVGLDGTMTCFQYETPRNLETIRIEGVSSSETCYSVLNASTLTAPERRTTTVWHPTLRMPVSITGPLRVDERTYDEHGNMTMQTLTATSDTNGAKGSAAQKTGVARVFTFSYDSNANVLSAKGPRTDVNDTTVYTYDAAGALQSLTNPLGQVTTYSNYDGNGRPGRISQANGVVNDITYHPRGWVSSRTVTSQGLSVITSFDHDGAGQLLKVTLPDSSALTYTYDAAHRVTDLGDSTGNSVHYTLDGAGNRLKEEVRGSAGNLTRQTARIYNAMSQLTQVTGGGQ